MNLRKYRAFCLFITALLISSCSSLDFVASGRTPFKISAGKNSERQVEVESSADFYFWGNSPGNLTIDLEDQGNELGLDLPSSVVISQTTSWKSFFYSVLTLGLYCPVDYKISLLTDKEPRK
jgi:hypothetical protein